MMAGLNAATAFNPLQALGAEGANWRGKIGDLHSAPLDPDVIRQIMDALRGQIPQKNAPAGIPLLDPSGPPPGMRLNELPDEGMPVIPVGDVVDFRKRGLFPQLGTEGARGYAGGANPQGWNVGQRATRTGTPEWNAAYEAQAGLKPGSLEPITRAPITAEFPKTYSRPDVMPGMSAKQLGQAIRNRPSAEDAALLKGMDAYTAKHIREISVRRGVSVKQILDETSGAVSKFQQSSGFVGTTSPKSRLSPAEIDALAAKGPPLPPLNNAQQAAYARMNIRAGKTPTVVDPRMPLAQKQAAEAQTLNKLRESNVQFEKQWSDFGAKQGIDPARAVQIARAMRVESEAKGLGHIPDSQIKFAITLLKQKGQL